MTAALVESFKTGWGIGKEAGQTYRDRKAGKAMADLELAVLENPSMIAGIGREAAAGEGQQGAAPPPAEQQAAGQQVGPQQAAGLQQGASPPAAPTPTAPQQGWQPPGAMTEGMPGQQGGGPPGEAQALQQGEQERQHLPSTRDWVELRRRALQAAANAGGADAVAEAHGRIDELQRTGFRNNLLVAREFIERGQPDQAAQYLERASSFHPDFGVLTTSPATMQDGSTQLMGVYMDEQTNQPRGPAMMVTTEVIDRLLQMSDDAEAFASTQWDRSMAERKLDLSEAKFGLDVERTAQDYTQPEADIPKPAEFRRVTKDTLKLYEEDIDPSTGMPTVTLTLEQKRAFNKAMAEAANPKTAPFLLEKYGSIEGIAEAAMVDILGET